MKKTIKSALLICLALFMLFPSTAFAEDTAPLNEPDWKDIYLTDEEFNGILSQNQKNEISVYATGLITDTQIAIAKSGTTLKIAGFVFCTPNVSKCGFKEVVIQRRKNSSSSWSTYKTYEKLYNSSYSYALTKSITVASGYQYRVTCVFYAKKNILSTQTINGTSNTVTI